MGLGEDETMGGGTKQWEGGRNNGRYVHGSVY